MKHSKLGMFGGIPFEHFGSFSGGAGGGMGGMGGGGAPPDTTKLYEALEVRRVVIRNRSGLAIIFNNRLGLVHLISKI